MGLETGDSISFILTIFSVILSIIPSIIPSKTNDLPPTNLALFQATIDLLNNSSKNYTFFAKNILHNQINSNTFIIDDNISSYDIDNNLTKTNIYNNLTKAISIYNNQSLSTNSSTYNNAINNLNTILYNNCKNAKATHDICNNIRFTIRMLDLQIDHGHNVNEDSFNCIKIISDTNKCSYGELTNLSKIKSQINKGFINYFYNERNITSLDKPIETFVLGLNQFFIAALLSGPGIFLTYIRLKSKNNP